MENPYQAPGSRIEAPESRTQELAGRGARLGASLLDAIILIAVVVPLEYFGGFFQQIMEAARAHERVPFGTSLMWSLIAMGCFAVIQGYPLLENGQTWGKKICSIKIVGLGGEKPPLPMLAVRYAVYMLVGIVPFIGPIASIVNVCFIFREDRRCGHDLAAGTKVVNA